MTPVPLFRFQRGPFGIGVVCKCLFPQNNRFFSSVEWGFFRRHAKKVALSRAIEAFIIQTTNEDPTSPQRKFYGVDRSTRKAIDKARLSWINQRICDATKAEPERWQRLIPAQETIETYPVHFLGWIFWGVHWGFKTLRPRHRLKLWRIKIKRGLYAQLLACALPEGDWIVVHTTYKEQWSAHLRRFFQLVLRTWILTDASSDFRDGHALAHEPWTPDFSPDRSYKGKWNELQWRLAGVRFKTFLSPAEGLNVIQADHPLEDVKGDPQESHEPLKRDRSA